jgi:hypothetical protein
MRHTSKRGVASIPLTAGGMSHETDRVWTRAPQA